MLYVCYLMPDACCLMHDDWYCEAIVAKLKLQFASLVRVTLAYFDYVAQLISSFIQ